MDPNFAKQYDEAERRFLKKSGSGTENTNHHASFTPETKGSLYRGRVLEADDGGMCFSRKTADTSPVPISWWRSLLVFPVPGAKRPATSRRAVPLLAAAHTDLRS